MTKPKSDIKRLKLSSYETFLKQLINNGFDFSSPNLDQSIMKHDVHGDHLNLFDLANLEQNYNVKAIYFFQLEKIILNKQPCNRLIKQISDILRNNHNFGIHLDSLYLVENDYSICEFLTRAQDFLLTEFGAQANYINLHGNTKLRPTLGSPKAPFSLKLTSSENNHMNYALQAKGKLLDLEHSVCLEELCKELELYYWCDDVIYFCGEARNFDYWCSDNTRKIKFYDSEKELNCYEFGEDFKLTKFQPNKKINVLIHPQFIEDV